MPVPVVPHEWLYPIVFAFGFSLGVALCLHRLQDRWRPDDRLVGTWQSDAGRTVAEWRERRPMTDEQTIDLGKLFGTMRLTFTRRTVSMDWSRSPLPNMKEFAPRSDYVVVARDATSAVVRSVDPLSGERKLTQIHFLDADHFWVHTDLSPMREYFRRVES